MTRHAGKAACIVTVDPQPWGPLITVTIERDLARAGSEPPRHFRGAADALAAVADFLGVYEPPQQADPK